MDTSDLEATKKKTESWAKQRGMNCNFSMQYI